MMFSCIFADNIDHYTIDNISGYLNIRQRSKLASVCRHYTFGVNKERIDQGIRQFNNDIAEQKRNIFRNKFVISFITAFIIMIAVIIIILHFIGYQPAIKWNNLCAETECVITNNSISLYGNKYRCYINTDCNDTPIRGEHSFRVCDDYVFKWREDAEYHINKNYPVNKQIKLFYNKNNLNDISLTKKSPTTIMVIEIILGSFDICIIVLSCVCIFYEFKGIHQSTKFSDYI